MKVQLSFEQTNQGSWLSIQNVCVKDFGLVNNSLCRSLFVPLLNPFSHPFSTEGLKIVLLYTSLVISLF